MGLIILNTTYRHSNVDCLSGGKFANMYSAIQHLIINLKELMIKKCKDIDTKIRILPTVTNICKQLKWPTRKDLDSDVIFVTSNTTQPLKITLYFGGSEWGYVTVSSYVFLQVI